MMIAAQTTGRVKASSRERASSLIALEATTLALPLLSNEVGGRTSLKLGLPRSCFGRGHDFPTDIPVVNHAPQNCGVVQHAAH